MTDRRTGGGRDAGGGALSPAIVASFLVAFLFWPPAKAGAAEVRATMGLERDDNPFQAPQGGRPGWASRFTVSAAGQLARRSHGALKAGFRGGYKRFWGADPHSPGGPGGVVTSDADLSGRIRVGRSVVVSGSAYAKVKAVHRVSSEEAYLRGSAEGAASLDLGRGFAGAARYRRAGEDSRSPALPDVSLNEAGVEARYGKSRRLTVRTGMTWRRLRYGRPALEGLPDGGVGQRAVRQVDRSREGFADLQGYAGILFQAAYAYQSVGSNSFGYGFAAHRMQGMLTRHLFAGIDAQVYATVQVRHYRDPLMPQGGRTEPDEYEHTLLILKASRQLTPHWGVSFQFGHFRNGARQGDAFYRKDVYTFSVDVTL